MRNGWHFPLEGLTAKWDMFAKTGKVASSAVVLKSGEITGINLKPGGKRTCETEFVEFKGTDSSVTGFTGHKYYGYRIRFYYRNTLVRVVALPEPLADWESAEGDE